MTNIKELIDKHNQIVDARLTIWRLTAKYHIMKNEQFPELIPELDDLDRLDEYIVKNAIDLCREAAKSGTLCYVTEDYHVQEVMQSDEEIDRFIDCLMNYKNKA